MPLEPDSLRLTKDIYSAYKRLNEKYWGGRLPENVTINIISPDGKGSIVALEEGILGGSGFSSEHVEEPLIELSAQTLVDARFWLLVLAHEMCHLAVDLAALKKTGSPTKSQHGKAWVAETRRLSKKGFLEEVI